MRPTLTFLSLAALGVALAGLRSAPPAPPCAPDNGGLTLPDGFCATLFAADLGPVRHLTVAPNGDVFAARSARDRAGVVSLRDTNHDGRADLMREFAPGGGSGIAIADGALYYALSDRILRYRLPAGALEPGGEPEVIVQGLPTGGHGAKGIAVRGRTLYSSVGSRTNSCQQADRQNRSPGKDPCPELETRAGIWRFAADRTGQSQQDGHRVATGLRNPMGIAIQPGTGEVYAAVNGRDQLGENWGFTAQDNAEKPAEEFVHAEEGADFGWPYCYYDPALKRKVLAPEYGGNGTDVGRCSTAADPAVAFPAHWAPLAVAFYNGTLFPARYRGGAFIAFHGSWNRAPLPQQGYRVAFVPFENGRPTGRWSDFATPAGDPTSIRPSGLAVGPDGALYLGADANGKIWRIVPR